MTDLSGPPYHLLAMPTAVEICRLDALTLARYVGEKRLLPVEVVDAVLERMERLEPVLHAFCAPCDF